VFERKAAKEGLTRDIAVQIGWSCQNGGNALLAARPQDNVVPVALRSAEMREYLVTQSPEDAESRRLLGVSYLLLSCALAHCPAAVSDDFEKTVQLASSRLAADPEFTPARRALGIALCREGRFEEAATALEKAIDAKLDEPVYDELFLAMTYAGVGRANAAKKQFDLASNWLQQNRPGHTMLLALHGEVGRTLAHQPNGDQRIQDD
jgi:tetratricopeptide (TPR) repeat protein